MYLYISPLLIFVLICVHKLIDWLRSCTHSHPTYKVMIGKAIAALKSRTGSSRQAIKGKRVM